MKEAVSLIKDVLLVYAFIATRTLSPRIQEWADRKLHERAFF